MPESPGALTDMPGPDKNNPAKALTCIHQRIHWAATDEPETDTDSRELEDLDIRNFVHTLAEIAMAVASRRLSRENDTE